MTAEKTTLVLLPGLNGTEGLFRPLLEQAPDSFDVICISYPTHEKQSYSQLTSHVLSKLEGIQGDYFLLGESFSGPISIFISSLKPKGLLGAILVATFISAPGPKIGRFLPWALGFRFAKPFYSLRVRMSRWENVSVLKAQLSELQKVSPDVMAFRIDEIFLVDVEKQLRECTVPLVYFRGKYDFVVPSWNMRKILTANPRVKVVEFNTQHFLLQSAPGEAWVAITEFVNTIKEAI